MGGRIITISWINGSWKSTLIKELELYQSQNFTAIHGSADYSKYLLDQPVFKELNIKNKYELFDLLSEEENRKYSKWYMNNLLAKSQNPIVIDRHLLLFDKNSHKSSSLYIPFIELISENYLIISNTAEILDRIKHSASHLEREKILQKENVYHEIELRTKQTLQEFLDIEKEYWLKSHILHNHTTPKDLVDSFFIKSWIIIDSK